MSIPFRTVDALVLRETKYKEADRILTLFTLQDGKITVKAPGALRKNSKISAATQMLSYSELLILQRNGFLTVSEAVFKEEFKGLRTDIEKYSLGCYFCECVETLTPEETPDAAVLQLALNSLYALSNSLYPDVKIKAAFEMRLMCLMGYEPDLSSCAVCGRTEPVLPTIGFSTGHIVCRECRNAEIGSTDYLCDESLAAMRYICSCDAKRLFSFEISDEALKRLQIACEHYIIEHAERHFPTLEYWKKIKI